MKPKEFFFFLLGLVVVILAAGAAGFYYGLGFLHAKSSDLATEYEIQQVAGQQITTLTNLQLRYQKQIVPMLPAIENSLPRSKNQTEILAQIERIASANGLSLSGVSMPAPTGLPSSVSQTIKAGDVLALPIDFGVKGSYAKLQAFTTSLENLNRFTNITSLSVQNQNDGTAQYTFNLEAYTKP